MKTFEEMTETVKQAKAPEAVAKRVDSALRALPVRAAQPADTPAPTMRVVRGRRARVKRPWQAAIGVAACAAVVGCLMASPLPQYLQEGADGSALSPISQLSTTSETDILGSMFRVAPAYGEGLALADSADPAKLVFASRDLGEMGDTGCFTGLTFKVEGDNIAQIAIRVSQGQLYRVTRTAVTRGDVEAMDAEGLLEDADGAVHMLHGDLDDESGAQTGFDDYCVAVGSSVEEAYDPDVAYGFYQPGSFDTQFADAGPKDAFWGLIDSFDGAVLEVTVTYTDGSVETKTYGLSSGKLKVEWGAEDKPGRLLQEFVTSDDEPFCYGLLASMR